MKNIFVVQVWGFRGRIRSLGKQQSRKGEHFFQSNILTLKYFLSSSGNRGAAPRDRSPWAWRESDLSQILPVGHILLLRPGRHVLPPEAVLEARRGRADEESCWRSHGSSDSLSGNQRNIKIINIDYKSTVQSCRRKRGFLRS